jgi:hypothetical protein
MKKSMKADAATAQTTAMQDFKNMLIEEKEKLDDYGGFIPYIAKTIIGYRLQEDVADNICKEVFGNKCELYCANGLAVMVGLYY